MTNDARIRQHGKRLMWTCPNCYHPLGEVCGVRLVVMIPLGRNQYRYANIPLPDDSHMTCEKCGTVSVYRRDGKVGVS